MAWKIRHTSIVDTLITGCPIFLNMLKETINMMTRITKTCGEPKPVPDILDWSKDVKFSNITGYHDLKDINQSLQMLEMDKEQLFT